MKKQLKIIILSLIVLFSASCSHYHNVKSEIYFSNLTGKGSHVILLYVNSSQVGDESLDSVQSKILPILNSCKPIPEMIIDSWIENTVLYFSFTYSFDNVDDFEAKAESITGNDYDFFNVKSSDPFYNVVTFSGFDIDESDFSYWAVKAIEDAEIFSYSDLTGATSRSGSSIFFDDSEIYTSNGVFEITNIWPIQAIFVNTNLNKQRIIDRTISLHINENVLTLEQMDFISQEKIKEYFQNKLASFQGIEGLTISDVEQISEDGLVKFNINASSNNSNQIANITETILLGFESSLELNYDEESKIVNYVESIYSPSFGYEEALESRQIVHTLDLKHYNLITVDDEPYSEDGAYDFEYVDNKITYIGNSLGFNLGIKYNPVIENLLLGIGGFLTLAILIILYTRYRKKHPRKLKESKVINNANIASGESLNDSQAINQFVITQIFEDAVEITTPDKNKIIVSNQDVYDNPQINDIVEYFSDGEVSVVNRIDSLQKVSVTPINEVLVDNTNYVVVEISDDYVMISKDKVNTIMIRREDAYDNPQVDDTVDYFSDDDTHMIAKK